MNATDFEAILPLIFVVVLALGMLIFDLYSTARLRLAWGVSACVLGMAAAFPQLMVRATAFHGLVHVDAFGAVFTMLILAGTALSLMLNNEQLELQRAYPGADVDVLVLFAAAGGIVMVTAANLIVAFVGFELLSVSVYVLTGIAKREKASAEGAMKYFILGAFSSAFLLYGMTLVYGSTGSMDLVTIGRHVANPNSMLLIGLGLIIFGFGFKVSLVPFHFWAPDVYQGAPVSIAGFMAVVVKSAAFGVFLRIMAVAFGSISGIWVGLLWTVAVLTMTVGNIVALRQRSIKRMLAYSSIAHAGYALIGLLVLGSSGGEALIFYLIAYTMMTVAAFGVVLVATAGSDAQYGNDDRGSLSGLGWTHPVLGFVMIVAMLSLGGMPPFGGFVGKFFLFNAAVKGGFPGLAVIAAINSVISLYYYLRILVVMYFSGERTMEWSPPRVMATGPALALFISTVGTIYLGLYSDTCIRLVRLAMLSIGQS